MCGAETARRPVVQRRIGGTEMAAPKWPSPENQASTRLAPLVIMEGPIKGPPKPLEHHRTI